MFSRKMIERALQNVYDPELGVNVVDLGLIYDIRVEEDGVEIDMTLTTRGCPLHDSIAAGVRNAVQALGIEDVKVNLVWEPAWTPERMTDRARQQLGY